MNTVARRGSRLTRLGNAVEWFIGEIKPVEQPMVAMMLHWPCPKDGCSGEMKYNGTTWPMGNPGYHHICTVCGAGFACHGGTFPRIHHRPA